MFEKQDKSTSHTGLEIAVIGMAGRFPGARNLRELWENLKNGVESIRFLSPDEAEQSGNSPDSPDNPNYIRAVSLIDDPDRFDSSFFGYTPREAETMDPQVRVFFECAWSALEDAGYDPGVYDGRIGLYAGAAANLQWETQAMLAGIDTPATRFADRTLSDKDNLSTLVSYKLNLTGPSFNVYTACSTSLVAVHLACRALLHGECKMALAGGVTVSLTRRKGYTYQEDMVVSPDGRCRPFDARGAGAIFSDGVGVVLLKRLKNAIEDGDFIHAVIKGSAINNDGMRKVGYTAPSNEGQMEVIRGALRLARVNPETVTYVETHGTATPLGDPIEIEGLKMAFNTSKKQYCAIGSIKSNFGHAGVAAGIAGFLKTVLCLKHRGLPPSLHFEKANPNIDFDNSPFFVVKELTEWRNDPLPAAHAAGPLRAGVSSFGIGGTNAHVVLEEAPPRETTPASKQENHLFLLSARTAAALEKMSRNLTAFLQENLENPAISPADISYTLQEGRRAFNHRLMLSAASKQEALSALEPEPGKPGTASDRVHTHEVGQKPGIVFLFSGLGPQYVDMGRGLYENEPVFREEMDHGFEILKGLLDFDIKDILYPPAGGTGSGLERTEVAQPALFLFQYALARLLLKWGVTPRAMIGYSFGEYAAACISGVFSLADALKLLVVRGKLMEELPPGRMLSVPAPVKDIEPQLDSELAIAINNGFSCVISGPLAVVDAFERKMKEKRLMCMKIPASHAFHSPMTEPLLERFTGTLSSLSLSAPRIPYISNVSGTWITVEQAADPQHWANHLRHTVQFAAGLEQLTGDPDTLFVEIGPGRDLTTMINRSIRREDRQHAVDLVRVGGRKISDTRFLLNKIGLMWLYGASVDWKAFHGAEKRRRLPLPTYPFEGQRFIVKDDLMEMIRRLNREESSPAKKSDPADWFYVPTWKRSLPGQNLHQETAGEKHYLLFLDENGVGAGLSGKLEQAGMKVTGVRKGSAYGFDASGAYTIRSDREDDYKQVFAKLGEEHSAEESLPLEIIYAWNLDPDENSSGFYSLLYITRGLSASPLGKHIDITAVTTGLFNIYGGEDPQPAKSTILGALKVIPQENPGIGCRCIDIPPPQPGTSPDSTLMGSLYAEIRSPSSDKVTALRSRFRWVQVFDPLPLKQESGGKQRLKKQGVYIITGGLGRIGLILARYLREKFTARLVLAGRSPLAKGDERRRLLRRIDPTGKEILVLTADAADTGQMRRVIEETIKKFQKIDGLVHAAGIIDSRPIHQLTDELVKRQFRAKVDAPPVLETVLQGQNLDFCLLLSSSSAVLGGLGFAAYAAANIYMDAFARARFSTSPFPWISYNLDVWDLTDGRDQGGVPRALQPLAMTTAEGCEAFERVVNCTVSAQVMHSTGSLQARIDQWINIDPGVGPGRKKDDRTLTLYPRPPLLTPYAPAETPLHHDLAQIWQQILGIDRIGIDDDFFELGGDSLKAITVIADTREQARVEVPLEEFFHLRTISQVSRYITGRAAERDLPPIEPLDKQDYYPLSSSQKRLYILHLLDPQSLVYNLASGLVLRGKLDITLLEESFRQLIRRHESFRTSFTMKTGQPLQRIHPAAKIDFAIEQVEVPVGPADPEIGRDFIRPFDLAQAPLIRVFLIKKGENEHILLIDMHHIVHDGVSQGILLREFTALYDGQKLPPLNIQYKDYAYWQVQNIEQGAVKEQGIFWLEEFRGNIPVLDLSYDFVRPALQDFSGAALRFTIDAQTTAKLKALALEQGVTLFMLLLTLYKVLLAKLSGQEDIVVGAPIAGRRHPGLQHIIGFFLNTLALRSRVLGSQTFISFLKDVGKKTLKAFDNQDYPFEDLVERTAPNRDLSRSPLFDTMFILHNQWDMLPGQISTQTASGLAIELYPYEKGTSEFDLTLIAAEEEDRLGCKFEYCDKLFKRETMERSSAYFKELVNAVLEDPGKTIDNIEMIPAKEREQLLRSFNDTQTPYEQDKTITELFGDQVQKSPDAVALTVPALTTAKKPPDPNRQSVLTYRQLDREAGKMAALLWAKGVRPGAVVGLMVERSPAIVIGILGILKAGAAYLPLDPLYPPQRSEYIVKSSAARHLLLNAGFKKALQESAFSGEIIDIDDRETYTEPLKTGNPGAFDPTQPAYVIYTSGSTGNPKGVVISRRSVVNFFKGMTRLIDFAPGKTILALTTISFDISVLELLLPLHIGMKILVAGDEEHSDPALLAKTLAKEKVNLLQLTPSHLQLLLSVPSGSAALSFIDTLMVGGEAFPQHLFENLKKEFKGKIYNMYGPTETTIWSTVKDLSGADRVTLGSPISNTQVYIVNQKNDKLQPIGAAGELLIAGDGVARGYLNNPELTGEKFRPDVYESDRSNKSYRSCKTGEDAAHPPSKQLDDRLSKFTTHHSPLTLYRTGDLARWLPNGEIEYLGRSDLQVKIRGYRIDLEEIEEQLLKLDDIEEAVVTVRTDEKGESFLAAYLISQKELAVSRIRTHLLHRLPLYMAPAHFTRIDAVPLTGSGKVDRRALPAPDSPRIGLATAYLAPGTGTEKIIADLWKEVLDIDKVGINDSFFDLGGNSLKVVHLNNRLKEELNKDIPVVSLFRYFTIGSFSKYLKELQDPAGAQKKKEEQVESLKQAANTYKNTIKQFKRGVKHEK